MILSDKPSEMEKPSETGKSENEPEKKPPMPETKLEKEEEKLKEISENFSEEERRIMEIQQKMKKLEERVASGVSHDSRDILIARESNLPKKPRLPLKTTVQ